MVRPRTSLTPDSAQPDRSEIRPDSTIPASSTTPAASAWSLTCQGGACTAPWPRRSTVLRNLDHRGAKGADPETGDGAGILTQIPDEFFRAVCDFPLPPPGYYAAGLAFLPAWRWRRRPAADRAARQARVADSARLARGSRVTPRPAGQGRERCCRGCCSYSSPRHTASAGSTWTVARSACVSAPSTTPGSTWPACPARRSCTRAC